MSHRSTQFIVKKMLISLDQIKHGKKIMKKLLKVMKDCLYNNMIKKKKSVGGGRGREYRVHGFEIIFQRQRSSVLKTQHVVI